ncbi:MAG: cytochrome c6 PetJ, partial [Pleurocapsa sp.]
MKKILIIVIMAIAIWSSANFPAIAVDTSNNAKIFQANCAGCHLGGGNIIRRGKNLKSRALQKNQMDNLAAITQLVTNGKNNMPAYGDRLTPEEIAAVSQYVLEQAATGWK